MMRQAAVLSGGFSGEILGRKPGIVRDEDLYQGGYPSLNEFDLLNPESGQRISLQDCQEPTRGGIPQVINIQTYPKSFTPSEDALQAIIEEPIPHAQESMSDFIDNLKGIPRTTRGRAQGGRPLFPRLVAGVLSENSKRIIGRDGAHRFEEFKRYHAGWDCGRGKPLSSRSVITLESFLRRLPEIAALEPSLFLTHEGNLQLGWEGADGNEVEIEFFPDKVEYYIEALREEDTVELNALHELVDKIRITIS